MDAAFSVLIVDLAGRAFQDGDFEMNYLGWTATVEASERQFLLLESGQWTNWQDCILYVAEKSETDQSRSIELWWVDPICPKCRSGNILQESDQPNVWELHCCGEQQSGDLPGLNFAWRDFCMQDYVYPQNLRGGLPGVVSLLSLEKAVSTLRCAADIDPQRSFYIVEELERFEAAAKSSEKHSPTQRNSFVLEVGKNLLDLSADDRNLAFLAAVVRLQILSMAPNQGLVAYFESLLAAFARKNLQLTQDGAIDLIDWGFHKTKFYDLRKFGPREVFAIVADSLKGEDPVPLLERRLLRIRDDLAEEQTTRSGRRVSACLKSIDICLSNREQHCVEQVDRWTVTFSEAVKGRQGQWKELVKLACSIKSTEPSRKFLKQAENSILELGVDQFAGVMAEVIRSIGQPSPLDSQIMAKGWLQGDQTMIDSRESQTLRGLIFSCQPFVHRFPEWLEAMSEAALNCYEKIYGYGPRAYGIGNALVFVISQYGTSEARQRLLEIADKVEHKPSLQAIYKAVGRCGEP